MNKVNFKLIFGMIILSLSGILLGVVLGYFATHTVLEKTVLTSLEKQGYVDTSLATATADDIVVGKTAASNGELISGTVNRFDTSDATATADYILKGKTAYVNGELVLGTLEVISNSEITPRSISTTVNGNVYVLNDITIAADEDLIGSNIRRGVSIFGIFGTYSGESDNEE